MTSRHPWFLNWGRFLLMRAKHLRRWQFGRAVVVYHMGAGRTVRWYGLGFTLDYRSRP